MTVAISGKIDTATVSQFQAAVDSISRDGKIVLDFAGVPYISSAGLRVLLMLRKRYPGDGMEIINVLPEVKEIFEITGFDAFCPSNRRGKMRASG